MQNKELQLTDNKSNNIALRNLINSENVKSRFKDILGKKSASFLSSILSLANSNIKLAECDATSIINCALVSATLDLPINQNLGFSYILPYKGKDGLKAQFQLGYKGFIQLAMRTGLYKTINATEVYEGQIKKYNPFTGEIDFDYEVKPKGEVVGYLSYFKLLNGFEKYFYMSIEQLQNHGKKFSKSYNFLWISDFPSMALKTVIKLLISKWGILSIDFQNVAIALGADQAVITENENGVFDYTYEDNPQNKEREENPPIDVSNVLAQMKTEPVNK